MNVSRSELVLLLMPGDDVPKAVLLVLHWHWQGCAASLVGTRAYKSPGLCCCSCNGLSMDQPKAVLVLLILRGDERFQV